jgi:hypothetical protein
MGERTILLDRAVALGDLKGTKTGQRRSVRLLAPLAADLAEWRLACGRSDEDALVFPTRDGRVSDGGALAQLAPARVRSRGELGGARSLPAVRPAAPVRLAPLRGGADGDRGRAAGWPLAGDGAHDLRACDRGGRGRGASARRGSDPRRAITARFLTLVKRRLLMSARRETLGESCEGRRI